MISVVRTWLGFLKITFSAVGVRGDVRHVIVTEDEARQLVALLERELAKETSL